MSETGQFWFNVLTKQVEEGHQSSWRDLMGPYPTRAAAERALEQAAARNRVWDADDSGEKG
ncbi:MAG TPA: SPOR domain-containing protein [Pengzhenrongella sp.]